MVRDGGRCKRLAVHDSTGGGRARLWLEGGRSRPFLIEEEEEKGCGPTSPGIWDSDDHVTSTTRTWLSLSLRDTAESPDRVMVASQAFLSWATFLEEENCKCHFELQFVFVVVGLVEKHFMTPEH